jgi:hypothetical protein
LRLGDIEGALSATEKFPKIQQKTFSKISVTETFITSHRGIEIFW